MKNKSKVLCIAVLIATIVFFFIFYIWNMGVEKKRGEAIAERISQYNEKQKMEEIMSEQKEKRRAEVTAVIPGIACWGDDTTYGLGGMDKSFPSVLQKLMEEEGYLIPVENLGIYGEDTLTVLGRANAIPFVVKDKVNITPNMEDDIVNITSQHGETVNPLLHESNPAVNPVTIDGVQGTLYGGVGADDISRVQAFFFVPDDVNKTMTIAAGTPVVTQGKDYEDYVSILAIGDNGGWNDDPHTLVSQQLKFVQTRGKNNDKYIIIGLMEGNNTDNAEADRLMEEAFGDRFLNVREYLCTEGIKDMKLSDQDKAAAERGEIPSCFRYDNRGFNDTAYEIIGKLVFDKLVSLGYIIK